MRTFSAYLFALFALVSSTAACGSHTSIEVNATNTAANVQANSTNQEVAEAGAENQTATAQAVVTDLYKQHDSKKSPFFQTKSRALLDKYFTKELVDMIWNDAITSKNEVGVLAGDPLYNAQDIEIKNFSIGKATVTGDRATVPVSFTNYTKKEALTFDLVRVSGAWKIDDINYGGGESLKQWFKAGVDADKQQPIAEFQGKFRVGDTTCTVKPVKMAFEIRWAKGSGVEMFFSQSGTSFESSPDKGEPNRFEFDDESYSTGTFYRGDGKVFPVKRLS
jgi:hypothetical protein